MDTLIGWQECDGVTYTIITVGEEQSVSPQRAKKKAVKPEFTEQT